MMSYIESAWFYMYTFMVNLNFLLKNRKSPIPTSYHAMKTYG